MLYQHHPLRSPSNGRTLSAEMKIKSAMFTAASGSVAGNTASHNRSGLYLRARVIPVNTNTLEQQAVRSALGNLSGRWNGTLTDLQRQAWNNYAALTQVTNVLGDQINLSGINQYVRTNTGPLALSIPPIDDAPTINGVGDTPVITSFVPISAGTFGLTGMNGTPALVTDVAYIYISRPQNPGINFFKGPYRWASAQPLTTGGVITAVANNLPFPVAIGQRVFYRVCTLRTDGRLSGSARGGAIVAT